MIYLLLAIPVVLFVARRIFLAKAYKVDKQGRYVLLDLAKPTLPPLPASVNFLGQFIPQKPFTVDGLIELARERAGGLSDFGDEARFPFRDGLEVFVRDVNRAPLTFIGRKAVERRVAKCLANRLLLEDLIKRHPEILQEEIRSPVFVVGMARSGTTHMQRMLSELRGVRSLKHYELDMPVVTPRVLAGIRSGKGDVRLAECRQNIRMYENAKPFIHALHSLGADESEEHLVLFTHLFRSLIIQFWATCPEYTEWLAKQDATAEFQYLRRCLQVIQWQDARLGKKRRRIVTKCITDVFSLPALKEAFPDAKIVHMHRDPSISVPSFLYLMTYFTGSMMSEIDLKAHGKTLVGYVESMMQRALRNGPQSGVLHVKYENFVENNMKVLKEVCEYIGEDLTGHNLKRIAQFMIKNRQHRFGKVLYDPTVFGFTKQELKEKFKFYSGFDSALTASISV